MKPRKQPGRKHPGEFHRNANYVFTRKTVRGTWDGAPITCIQIDKWFRDCVGLSDSITLPLDKLEGIVNEVSA